MAGYPRQPVDAKAIWQTLTKLRTKNGRNVVIKEKAGNKGPLLIYFVSVS
ncbi:MAG: hypothetical protein ACU0BH_10720 [Paracoccaceae bacterium]